MKKLPQFQIKAIEDRRDRLVHEVLAPWLGQTLGSEELQVVATRAARLLPGVKAGTVFESVRSLLGQPLQADTLVATAWRLAGNLPRLQDGLPTPAWTAQRYDEWVPVRILRASAGRDHNQYGYWFTYAVLAGTPCPMPLHRFWTPRIARLLSRKLGFSRYKRNYIYRSPLELVGLRLLVQIEAARSDAKPWFFHVECPPAMLQWNRDNVLRLRCRVRGAQCPRGYRHLCSSCAVGYDSCPAAVHPSTYVIRPCEKCDTPKAYWDPDDPRATRCLSCDRRRRLAKRATT